MISPSNSLDPNQTGLAVPGGPPRASVVGTGLIGSSIGMALKAQGWRVAGHDTDPVRLAQALELGAIDVAGHDEGAEIVFVATPVSGVVNAARQALAVSSCPDEVVVTDVGGIKASVVDSIGHGRFVGGHPMAGSEQEGVAGAVADLFNGATWVLTPTDSTDVRAYARARSVVSSLGAEVVALDPRHHDDLVAVVSHVPHLTAATLMALAADGAEEHAALLRLAAGGFRDMTRIAAGHPGIWPDICMANSVAILGGLDRLVQSLTEVRNVIATGDRAALMAVLERARGARMNLPARWARPTDLVEVRIPVPDRPGMVAEVSTLAGQMGVNIEDMEIAHSAEGERGVLVLVIGARAYDPLREALVARGLRPSMVAIA